jgi:hypothetical protein
MVRLKKPHFALLKRGNIEYSSDILTSHVQNIMILDATEIVHPEQRQRMFSAIFRECC